MVVSKARSPKRREVEAVLARPSSIDPTKKPNGTLAGGPRRRATEDGFQAGQVQKTDSPRPVLGAAEVARHVGSQPWFAGDPQKLVHLKVLDQESVNVPGAAKGDRYLLAALGVHGGDHYLAPLKVGSDGAIGDALADPAFKSALVDEVSRGRTTFQPSLLEEHYAASTQPPPLLRRPEESTAPVAEKFDPKVEISAIERALAGEENNWSVLKKKGYSSPQWLEFFRAQAKVLNPKQADEIVVRIYKEIVQTLEAQPKEVRAFHEALATQREFTPTLYGYAQYMGVPEGKSTAKFSDLVRFLDVAQGRKDKWGALGSMVRTAPDAAPQADGLGFQTVFFNPFFKSPLRDMGYDISDFFQVDERNGGDTEHASFMKEAVDRRVRVIADLVANHVSNEHPWVKGLEAGDASTLGNLVLWDDAVKIGERTVDGKVFNVMLHTRGENAGKVSHVWQIFPDNNPDTFIPLSVNGEKHQGFASFMNPDQVDINNAEPNVLAHHAAVIGHFANLGQMGTRFDAIIHGFKKPGTDNVNLPETRALMSLMKGVMAHVAPGSIAIPEANVPGPLGRQSWLDAQMMVDGKPWNTTGDALLSFGSHEANWDALLTHDKTKWLKNNEELGEVPTHKSFLNYLGLHDETLIPDAELRKQLIAGGATDFAGRGLGDSTAALLGHDADRIAMGLALSYAGKGHPAVYYRTIVGAGNDVAFAQANVELRLEAQKAAGLKPDRVKATDSRDLDRGPISIAAFEKALAEGYKPAVTVRALNHLWDTRGSVRTNDITEVPNPDKGVLSLARVDQEKKDAPLLNLINLTGERKTVRLHRADLAARLGWKDLKSGNLRDILQQQLSGAAAPVAIAVRGDVVELELGAYQTMYLERG
jgi:glycosidase